MPGGLDLARYQPCQQISRTRGLANVPTNSAVMRLVGRLLKTYGVSRLSRHWYSTGGAYAILARPQCLPNRIKRRTAVA